MIAQQILLDESTGALPVRAEEDRNAVVDDDGKSRADNRRGMRAGPICAGDNIIQPGFHDHAGAVIFRELQEFLAEPLSVADNRVNEVFRCLPFHRYVTLQTGE